MSLSGRTYLHCPTASSNGTAMMSGWRYDTMCPNLPSSTYSNAFTPNWVASTRSYAIGTPPPLDMSQYGFANVRLETGGFQLTAEVVGDPPQSDVFVSDFGSCRCMDGPVFRPRPFGYDDNRRTAVLGVVPFVEFFEYDVDVVRNFRNQAYIRPPLQWQRARRSILYSAPSLPE